MIVGVLAVSIQVAALRILNVLIDLQNDIVTLEEMSTTRCKLESSKKLSQEKNCKQKSSKFD